MRATLPRNRHDAVIGRLCLIFDIFRRSCSLLNLCIILPEQRNNIALKNACVHIWNKATIGFFSPMDTIISPSCLVVE